MTEVHVCPSLPKVRLQLVVVIGGLVCCADVFAQSLTVQQPAVGNISVGTTVSAPNFGGIVIDAGGVVTAPEANRVNRDLDRKVLRAAAAKTLSADMMRTSPLRKVSLRGLEAELAAAAKSGRGVSRSCRHLAGLTQLEYVIADHENGDVILAGPAEGFAETPAGSVVGVESGRPTLALDDLLVMLRTRTLRQALGCSFDPDKSRLAKAQAWYQSAPATSKASEARRQFAYMAELLGGWNVRVFGLPPNSHAALRMVDADFQMKRVNLGLRRTGIRGFRSQLAMMRPEDNSLRRYWFAPRYNPIERSPAGDVFRLSGPRLQLMAQEELADAQGNRTNAAFTEVSTQEYTRQFNRHMDELARRVPAFAAVQNLFDVAIAAALIRRDDLFAKVGWQPEFLLDGERLTAMVCPVVRQVPSQVNSRTAGRRLVLFQIGGGVSVVPDQVISRTVPLSEPVEARVKTRASDGAWWWD